MPFQDNNPNGLFTISEIHHVPVPLKNVKLDVKLVDFCCEVTVSQTYINCESNPIECVYNFPVEEAAAVVDFVAELEGRTIKTKVQEKMAARQEYREAMVDRKTAVLLEETKQDIFEVKVGHLSPGSSCEIKIVYIMELPVELGTTKLTIPTTVAPRYVPIADESPEAVKIANIKHDFNSPVRMSLSLDVLMQKEIVSVTSPSHQIEVTNKTKVTEYFVTSAKFEGDTKQMDRDLIVLVKSGDPHEPRVLVEKDEEDSHVAMLTFVPDFKLVEHKIEAIFLVDCSGSMRGSSMDLAKEALLVFLHSLPVSSFFNVITFGSTYKSLFPESRIYDDDSFQDAKTSIQGISSNMGGTEILSPLSFILQQEVKAGLARQVFVLTDGQVSNTSACISLVRKHVATNRVFTLGVGSAADRHLVKGLARAGQGTALFTSQGEQITPKIMEQLKNALQPCIADIEVRWGKSGHFEGRGEMEVEVETKKTLLGFGKPKSATKFSIKNQVPSKVPPIYDGGRLIIYKKMDKKFDIDEEIAIKAKTTEGVLEHTFKITTDSFIEGRNLHQLFARKLIQEIEEDTEINEEAKELITELGMKYNLASKCTSFVGVDEKITSSHQNYLAMGMKTRQVPNRAPFGSVSMLYAQAYPPPQAHCSLVQHCRSITVQQCHMIPAKRSADPVKPQMGPRDPRGSCMASSDFEDIVEDLEARSFIIDNADDSDISDGYICEEAPEQPHMDPGGPSPRKKPRAQAINTKTETHVPPESKKPSPCVMLTLTQNANGSFPVSEEVTGIMNLDLEKTLEHGKPLDPQAWMTLICIAYLKKFCEKDKVIWELAVTKAEKWLSSSFPNIGEDSSQKALAEFVHCFTL